MKFTYGDKVIINKNLVGIVLSGYVFDHDKEWEIYRVAVDAGECAVRISCADHMDQTNDPHLLIEDWGTFFKEAKNIIVLETSGREMELCDFVQKTTDKFFVNGFDLWIDTFFQITSHLEFSKNTEGKKSFEANENGGTRELRDLAIAMTNMFEDEHSEVDWEDSDRDFLDEIDEFIERNNL